MTTGTGAPEMSNEQALGQFLELIEAGDMDAAARFAHEDIVMEWPQSGERFTGRANALAALRTQEAKPTVAGEPRLAGAGDHWVIMMPVRYGEDVYHYVGVFQFDGGRIRRATEYFGAPFPAPEARAPYADRT